MTNPTPEPTELGWKVAEFICGELRCDGDGREHPALRIAAHDIDAAGVRALVEENERLRATLSEHSECQDLMKKATAEIERLRADARRVDWLDNSDLVELYIDYPKGVGSPTLTLRENIDAVMAGGDDGNN